MPRNHRVSDAEFAIIRRYYNEVGANWQLIVSRTRRDVAGNEYITEDVQEMWRNNSDQQLRRRVQEAVQNGVQE